MTPAAADPPAGVGQRRTWGSIAGRWVPVALVLGGCVYLARTVDLEQLKATLLTVSLAPLGLALGFAALGVVAHAAYWWVVINRRTNAPASAVEPAAAAPAGRHVTLRAMVIYSFASYATNTFLPFRGGEALRVWLVRQRHGVPVTVSAAIIAIEKIADVLSLLLLVSPLPWLIPDLPPSVGQALRVLPCIVLAGVIAIGVASRSAVRWTFLQGFHILRRPSAVAAAFACIFLAWILDVCAILSVLLAVHVAPTLEKALVVILSVNIAVAIPATPGQVGAHEIGSTVALHLVGVPEAPAMTFAFLYHATQLLPILLIGLSTARSLSSARPPEVADA